jgi:hypothetical protein
MFITKKYIGRHDTQHNDTQYNDTQHNDIQHNDTQHNDIQHNDIQHNDTHPNRLICDTHHKRTSSEQVSVAFLLLLY